MEHNQLFFKVNTVCLIIYEIISFNNMVLGVFCCILANLRTEIPIKSGQHRGV